LIDGGFAVDFAGIQLMIFFCYKWGWKIKIDLVEELLLATIIYVKLSMIY